MIQMIRYPMRSETISAVFMKLWVDVRKESTIETKYEMKYRMCLNALVPNNEFSQ